MSNSILKKFPPREYFKSTGNKTYDILKENIDRLEENNLEYAVWGGAGSWERTKVSIEKYTGKPSREKYIVDNNKALADGVHRLTPEQLAMHMDEIDTIFICVYVADIVKKQIIEMGYTGNIVIMICFSWLGPHFHDVEIEKYNDYKNLFDLMEDDLSKKTIIEWMRAAFTGDMSLFENINGNSEFKLLENSILNLGQNEKYVDVGAFDGDTVEAFLKITENQYDKIVAIEAETDNYKQLVEKTSGLKNVSCLNIAAGSRDAEVNFVCGQSESGYVSDDGDALIKMAKLDSIPEIQDATFIKISANLNEYDIIEGAKDLIKRNKPKLSYYCAADQKWKIPMLLRKILPEYKFYLRHYGYGIQALIGYAVCEE